jgi:hypothetical protein
MTGAIPSLKPTLCKNPWPGFARATTIPPNEQNASAIPQRAYVRELTVKWTA